MKPFIPRRPAVPKKTSRVTFDLETRVIAPGIQAPPIAGMGFKIAGEKRVHLVLGGDPALYRIVRGMLEDRSVRMVGTHVRFDMACLLAYEPEWAELVAQKFDDDGVGCTLIRDCLIRIAKANPMEENLKYNLSQAYKLYVRGGALNVDKEDPWRMRWGLLAGKAVSDVMAHPEESKALDYLTTDVLASEGVWEGQERHSDWLLDEYRQVRASFVLYCMQAWGVKTDPGQVACLAESTRKVLDDAAKLCEARGLVIDGKRNIAAASAAQEAAYARLGLDVPRNDVTEKGRERVYARSMKAALKEGLDETQAALRARHDADNLLGNVVLDEEACATSRDPLMVAYSTVSQSSLLLGKVRRLGKPLIQASYDTLKNTGRTSCRQGSDPKKGFAPSAHGSQMQNPPREVREPCPVCSGEGPKSCPRCKGDGDVAVPGIREAFIARPGFVIVSIDFDAFEMRTWAQCCLWMVGFSKLAEILNDPKRCPHVEMGARILNMALEEAYGWHRGKDKRIKRVRNLAKGPNFGLPGGMGAERLVAYCFDNYGVELDPDPQVALQKAKDIIRVWREIYPEAPEYLNLISRMVSGGEASIDEVTGRKKFRARIVHHHSARVRGGVGYCDAANSFFQGLAADGAKASLWAIWKAMYADRKSVLYGSRQLAFVHDELVAEVPMARGPNGEGVHERCLELQRLWVGEAQKVVPDVLISASPAAAFRWSKSAGDPLFNAAGRIMPYECVQGYAGLPAPEGQMELWEKYESR